jgi:TRAP-type uncharacterized transport system substrate-binding protein
LLIGCRRTLGRRLGRHKYYRQLPDLSYDGQPAEIPSAAVMNLFVIGGAISEDVLYLMTKSRFDYASKVGLACRQAQHRLS